VHEITSQHVDTLLDFFEDTTRHEPHPWPHTRRPDAHADARTQPAALLAALDGALAEGAKPGAGTVAMARRLGHW